MKNLRLNILILLITTAFSAFGAFSAATTSVQTKSTAKPKPTPKKPAAKTTPKTTSPQTSAKPSSKTTPKTTAQTVSKPVLPQIIVAVTSARIRKEADTNAETLELAKLGTIFPVAEQTEKWTKISFSKDGKQQNGWVAKTVSLSFTNTKRAEIYQTLADKYLKQSAPDFATAAQVSDFLNVAVREVKVENLLADLSFKRLLALQNALRKIAIDKQKQTPYQEFLKANQKEIIYSEPSAEWLVRSELFWRLHAKYKILPIGEEIAWAAAKNPIPGECEGYINCYLYQLRSTDGEYLNFYPGGKNSRQSLKNITDLLEPIAADAAEKTIYTSPSDTSDRAEFNRYLTELRAIITKTPHIEKSKTLAQIRQIAEAHR